jgi:predicted RNA-binding protein with RPS1 domain
VGSLHPDEERLIGQLVEGVVEAVFRWGVIVELGLSRKGLIDALYIDDGDDYQVGDRVEATLTSLDENKDKILLLPKGQTPVADRLREIGFDL